MEYLLEMRDISKFYPGVKALNRVSFRVRSGSVHALMGENGAGKSTLMKILAGIEHPDEGEVVFSGKKVRFANPRDALREGIAMIHQELMPIPEMTIAENLFLGREFTRKGRLMLDYASMNRKAKELLENIGVHLNPKLKMKHLTVSEMQMIEIAKAISIDSKIIIMDEPTSAITDREVDQLFKVIKRLKSQGKGIIYISHKMNEIFQIADDITVFRDGQYVDTKPADETNNKELIAKMVGRELTDIFPEKRTEMKEPLLTVKNLTKSGKFRNISFTVRRGEIVGIAGLMGSGRSEVMEAIFGLQKLDEGEIYVAGNRVKIRKPSEAIANGIAFLTEDRKAQGLNLLGSIRHNITISSLKRATDSFGFIQGSNEKAFVDRYMDSSKIKASSRDQSVGLLSGGNQQKVVIAKWLMTSPQILILDEPTRGIDVGAKSELYKLMSQFAAEGYGIIMISSELPEILGMSDRILVFHEGGIAGELSGEDATQEKIMELATGHHHDTRGKDDGVIR